MRTVRTKRATGRGNKLMITKCINEAKDLLENYENINESITSVTKDRLNTLNDLLDEKLKVVKEYDDKCDNYVKSKKL